MSKNTFTRKQARAHSKAAPRKAAYKPGTAGHTTYGRGKDKMFKPGVRTGATGPESGRHGK